MKTVRPVKRAVSIASLVSISLFGWKCEQYLLLKNEMHHIFSKKKQKTKKQDLLSQYLVLKTSDLLTFSRE